MTTENTTATTKTAGSFPFNATLTVLERGPKMKASNGSAYRRIVAKIEGAKGVIRESMVTLAYDDAINMVPARKGSSFSARIRMVGGIAKVLGAPVERTATPPA